LQYLQPQDGLMCLYSVNFDFAILKSPKVQYSVLGFFSAMS
jgi:hypothetical protein